MIILRFLATTYVLVLCSVCKAKYMASDRSRPNFSEDNSTPNGELVREECVEEYEELNEEPIKEEKVLRVQKSDDLFDEHACELQIPGYAEKKPNLKAAKRHRRRHHESRQKRHSKDIRFTYSNYAPSTAPTFAPHQNEGHIEVTQLVYRIKKGIHQLNLCELETYYVRRYNRFPFYVKSVSCQKNAAISGKIKCRPRYEKGHILRLENTSSCYQENNNKWVHDWETRVVGCDAILYTDPAPKE